METAIKKAIEGGWGGGLKSDVVIEFFDKTKTVGFHYPGTFNGVEMSIYDLLLQPLFWQALGKAEGWRNDNSKCNCRPYEGLHEWECPLNAGRNDWKDNWHNFIDHLAQGKDIDSFFDDLLQKITKEK